MKTYLMNTVRLEEVIISTKEKRGLGKTREDPVRCVTQVFSKEGELIAEYDPITEEL